MMMRVGLRHIAAPLSAAAVAATISAAPIVAAAPADDQQPNEPQESCTPRGDGSPYYKCERGLNVPGRNVEGSVELNDPPTANHYYSVLG
jgi:hypothetical protein